MFKTFKDSLVEIEQFYNDKNYHTTVVESAKLAERGLAILFNHFHSFLSNKKEWLAYLEFERQNGDKYNSFLKRPTIGVAIGFYSQLLERFPGQTGLTEEIRRHLNTINTVRNAHVHASGRTVSSDEAGTVLDALEKILHSTNLIKLSTSVIGVPIKYYLVLRSIVEKYEKAESESDFKKIVDDSLKILPALLNLLLNRVYHDLDFEKKEKLIELYAGTVDSKKTNELTYYINLCLQLDFQPILQKGNSLNESLEAIQSDMQVNYSRRQTRHYVNILEIIAEIFDIPESRPFLEFADSVKKRYLVKHSLTDRDRIILEDKARESKISKDLATRIEESVIQTIDKELTLFQTLTAEDESAPTTEVIAQPRRPRIRQYVIAGAVGFVFLAIGAWYFLIRVNTGFTDYEKAYFAFQMEDANRLAKKKLSLNNIKANFYYILSDYFRGSPKISSEVRKEYQKLLKENPKSDEAKFYLGMIYAYDRIYREELDSAALLLLDCSERIKSVEVNFVLNHFFANGGVSNYAMKTAEKLALERNPRAKTIAANSILEIQLDTPRSMNLFKEAIHIYPNYIGPYLRLSELYINKKEYDSAKMYLQEAYGVNSKHATVISGLANLSREEGRFDEAKKYFRDALQEFAQEDVNFHAQLVNLLFQEDSVAQAKALLMESLKKFPDDRRLLGLKYQIEMREKSLATGEKEVRSQVQWVESLEEGMKQASKENKPLMVNFFAPWSYWATYMDKKIYTDSTVGKMMAQFVPVKVNVSLRPDLEKKYSIKSIPFIHILNEKGEKVSELGKFYNVPEFIQSLNESLNRYNLIASADKTRLTSVSNFEDARILAKNKNIPIVVVVGDERSVYSKQFVKESMNHPLVKAAMSNVAYLYLEKNSNDPLLVKQEVSAYPSLFFFNKNGQLVSQSFGSLPGFELSQRIEEFKKDQAPKNQINWFYSLDEAKAYAMVKKKNIFISFYSNACETCSEMDRTYADSEVIHQLNENFVNVKVNINTKEGFELWRTFGIGMPSQVISSENGEEYFRFYGHQDATQLLGWLDIREKMKLVSVLGLEEYKKFSEENFLAKEFVQGRAYQAASVILKKQVERIPEYGDLYQDLAVCYYNLKKADDAINAFDIALKKGVRISERDINTLVSSFIMAMKLNELPTWIEKQLASQSNPQNQSYLQLALAKTRHLLADLNGAEQAAKLALSLNPKLKTAYLLLSDVLIAKKRAADAMLYLDKGLKTLGEDPALLAYKGLCYHELGNDPLKATYYNKASKLNNFVGNMLAKHDLLFTDNFDKYPIIMEMVAKSFEDGVRINSDNAYLRYRLSLLYLMEGRATDAEANLRRAIEIEPAPNAKAALYVALHAGNKFEQAIEVAKDVESSTPDFLRRPVMLLAMGLHYKYLKKNDEAKRYFNEAVKYREPEAWERHFQKLAENELTNL